MLMQPSEIDALYGIHRVEVFTNGLVIHRKQRFPMARKPPTARKGVYEMSQKSKLKLAHIVANCGVKFSSMFTLTYGDFFIPHDGRELKRQLNVFLTRFKKRFITQYIWFLEFTKRDRPHIHVICNVNPSQFDRVWLGVTWSKISVADYAVRLLNRDADDPVKIAQPFDDGVVADEAVKVAKVHAHAKAWEMVRKSDGAARYCLKYALKSEQKLVPIGFQNVGRFWWTSRSISPKPLAELIVGETMTEARVREILLNTRVGQYDLIPKYVFENDAMTYFTSRGLLLTEIFATNGKHKAIILPEL